MKTKNIKLNEYIRGNNASNAQILAYMLYDEVKNAQEKKTAKAILEGVISWY